MDIIYLSNLLLLALRATNPTACHCEAVFAEAISTYWVGIARLAMTAQSKKEH
jgi:hypothetical protein